MAGNGDESRERRIVPLVDAVSCLSMPHVALLGWRCVFQGHAGEAEEATVLSYYGTEWIVRCPVPTSLHTSSPFVLSLVPGNKMLQLAGWTLEGLRLREYWKKSAAFADPNTNHETAKELETRIPTSVSLIVNIFSNKSNTFS